MNLDGITDMAREAEQRRLLREGAAGAAPSPHTDVDERPARILVIDDEDSLTEPVDAGESGQPDDAQNA